MIRFRQLDLGDRDAEDEDGQIVDQAVAADRQPVEDLGDREPAEDLGAAEVRRLMEIGLHAAFNGQPNRALRLFEALSRLRPDAAFPRIGMAQSLLTAGREAEAVRVLEVLHAVAPQDDDVRVMLGLALRIARRAAQTERVLLPLLDDGRDARAARLARRLIALPMPGHA